MGANAQELAPMVIATDHTWASVLPNFFIEAKGADRAPSGAQRQGCHVRTVSPLNRDEGGYLAEATKNKYRKVKLFPDPCPFIF